MTETDLWLQKLQDEDSKVKEGAVYALGELGDTSAVEPLIIMLEDPSSDVRKSAAVALGWLKDIRAVDPLLNYLKKAQTSEFSSITYALSELKDKKAVEPLIQIALGSDSQQIRKPCIRALGKLNDKRAIIPFLEILSNKEARDFHIFTNETLDRMLDDEGIKTLIQAFDCSNDAVKWIASRKLRELSEKSYEPLIQAIKEGSGDIRKHSIITIAEMKEIKDIEFLNQFIEDENLKYHIAIAFGKRGNTRALEILIAGLTHLSAWVREHSALALGIIKDRKAFDALIIALKDTEREVRAAAAFALGELKDEKAIDPLIQAMISEKGEDWYTKGAFVRETIAKALGEIGGHASKPLLTIFEESKDWNLRFIAAVALAAMKNHVGINYLVRGLLQGTLFLQYACRRIIKELVKENKISPELLKKHQWSFRWE
ncbi:HEAT repeat domain-containing protein [Candidatus Borrarchaeum sp.]|uniref:HEAT repeat domain-containing protein n=1 Tax=Candidatus Borrarchaeum sp. TaxID=2846742 RepID=UPI00257C927E|nr:HEAT repeat domain-containing protein [Candidatus Borrarchaeum sp.]